MKAVRCAYFGRLASWSASESLCIWECESTGFPDYQLEGSLPVHAPSRSALQFDWLSLGNGGHILAVGCGPHMTIYNTKAGGSKHGAESAAFGVGWEAMFRLAVPEHVCANGRDLQSPCTSVAWRHDGTLLVATTDSLLVFPNRFNSAASPTAISQSIFIQASHWQRPLPHYHPTQLLDCLIQADFPRLSRILSDLLLFLKSHAPESPSKGNPSHPAISSARPKKNVFLKSLLTHFIYDPDITVPTISLQSILQGPSSGSPTQGPAHAAVFDFGNDSVEKGQVSTPHITNSAPFIYVPKKKGGTIRLQFKAGSRIIGAALLREACRS